MTQAQAKTIQVFALILENWCKLLDKDAEIEGIDIRIPDSTIEYEPTLTLQEGQWFMLKKFNETNFSNKLCETSGLNTVDYNSSEAVPSIKALAFIKKEVVDSQEKEIVDTQIKEVIGFQRITSTKVISNRPFLSFNLSGVPFIHDFKGVIIGNGMDAVFDKQKDILYFRDLSKLNFIFPRITELHRQANNAELTKFLNVTCAYLCKLEKRFLISNIKVPNRKSIARLIDDKFIASLSSDEEVKYVDYCNKYLKLEKSNDKFLIKSEAELTLLIKALDQKYYVTSIREETRESTSYRTIAKKI